MSEDVTGPFMVEVKAEANEMLKVEGSTAQMSGNLQKWLPDSTASWYPYSCQTASF